ncbi:unnamed protein product [Lepeophtheirus salmonis]|uniref:(salmon louse) hypothetical protein n=1 Tax=Lepeophtheirus salmonis TaxID=72036 RepID=A0A7R8CM33_LEPSM|nr:unnamed protein product [Lepeophtheirus salmonis]CAF2862876.1 unnamed protein product [Lepeophtheirus salmonis]
MKVTSILNEMFDPINGLLGELELIYYCRDAQTPSLEMLTSVTERVVKKEKNKNWDSLRLKSHAAFVDEISFIGSSINKIEVGNIQSGVCYSMGFNRVTFLFNKSWLCLVGNIQSGFCIVWLLITP